MAERKDKDGESVLTTDHGGAGRIAVDGRGNSVWRWARNAIDNALDSTSILLKRLENKDLTLEPTQKVPIAREAPPAKTGGRAKRRELRLADPSPGPDSVGGFDPYNSGR